MENSAVGQLKLILPVYKTWRHGAVAQLKLNDQKLFFFKFGGWEVVALPTRPSILPIWQLGS